MDPVKRGWIQLKSSLLEMTERKKEERHIGRICPGSKVRTEEVKVIEEKGDFQQTLQGS